MALINKEIGFIYTHIYKTAGNSVRLLLWGEEIAGVHCSLSYVKEHFSTRDPEFFESALKFAVVRHPYEWIGSTRDYILRYPKHRDYAETFQMTPYEFVEWERDVALKKDWLPGANYHDTQKGFLYEGDTRLVDYVIKMENIDVELKPVLSKLGIEYDVLPKKNVGQMKGNKYADTFDNETKKLIQEVYGEDFRTFGYGF